MSASAWLRFLLLLIVILLQAIVKSEVRRYEFNVVMRNTTKLCSSKQVVTINGRFPGPNIYAREDDTLLIKVVNHVSYNMTIHWHGIRQLRTGWADGPAYITQCPIQSGESYVYNFTVSGQRGTLFWHAHILWLRATVHGAIIILPKHGVPYPFPIPHNEEVIILGEWWKSDVEAVIDEAMALGSAPNVSDAYTINGHPGPMSNCLQHGGYNLVVMPGKTYLLRIINAALNTELFFRMAKHKMRVVEADAAYVKPFVTDTILLSPGQTTNVLVTTHHHAIGGYQITVSPFRDSPIEINNTTATATLIYAETPASAATVLGDPPPQNATPIAATFTQSLRGLNSAAYPSKVPLQIDHSLLFTIGLGAADCRSCANSLRLRPVGDINNVTFVMPTIALLNAHYFKIGGVFTDDFPGKPAPYDYTGVKQPGNWRTMSGTRLYRLAYNSTVQVVLQGTAMIFPENHPIHLHGSNFFVVGMGLGNFDPEKDPNRFNLVDPVERNTIAVPSGGWVAIRFRADNPGVWFLHCHLEVHTTWGLKMAFVVDNGKGPNEFLLPPPNDLPKC